MDLSGYAAIAEIAGGLALLGGGAFGLIQLREYRRRRAAQVAADLCREFTKPDLARAITLLRTLPDDIGRDEMSRLDPVHQEAAQIVGMTFETMGLLVQKEIASFRIVQELTGGLLLMMWRKIGAWTIETRQAEGNPRFGEWMQWLAERVAEREAQVEPAYLAHASWERPGT